MGKLDPEKKWRVMYRDEFRCVYCGRRARRTRRSSPDTELSDALARLEESLQAVVRIAVERDKQLEALKALLR